MDFFAGMLFAVFVLLLGGGAGYVGYNFLKSREEDK